MEIRNVNTTTPVYRTAQVRTMETEAPIEHTVPQKKDSSGGEKILASLTVLGAIALAGISLYKHNKKAAQKIAEAQEVFNKPFEKALSHKSASESAQAMQEAWAKQANEAQEAFKKPFEGALSHKSASESAQAMREAWAKENSQNVTETISLATKNKGLKQGIKSQNLDELITTIDTANANAKQAQELADKASDYAKSFPTEKNIKRAKIAQNNAIQAQLEAEKITGNADKRFEELVQKEAHQNAQKASPNYEAGLAKQKAHQDVTDNNAIKRQTTKKTQKPAYQRAVANLKRRHISDTKEGLERVINSNKFSETEKEVAKDLLEAMKK